MSHNEPHAPSISSFLTAPLDMACWGDEELPPRDPTPELVLWAALIVAGISLAAFALIRWGLS